MKVVLKPAEADKPNVRGWLKPTTGYVVLAVEAEAPRSIAYRIETEDNGTPALFGVDLFTVVDNRLPRSWVAVQPGGVLLQLMPESWSQEGFWERFFDGDPDARRCYEETSAKIRADAARPAEGPDRAG